MSHGSTLEMFLVKQESNSNSTLSGSASQFLEPFRFENLITVSVQRKQKHRKGVAAAAPAHRSAGTASDTADDATQPQFASIVKRVPRRLLLQQGCVTASELPPALPHATGGGDIASNDCCISFTNQAPRALACHYMILTTNGKTGEGSNG